MIVGELPSFRKGVPWKKVPADQMQNLVKAVKILLNIQVGTGLQIEWGPAGPIITMDRIDIPPSKAVQSIRHVVLVVEPDPEEDETLFVREVTFDPDPEPEVGSPYRWKSENNIECIPIFGSEIKDFIAYFWDPDDPIDGGVPVLGTPFLKLQTKVGNKKLLWLPNFSSTSFCVVRDFPDQDNLLTTIPIQQVRENKVIGFQYDVNVWPAQVSGDYRGFIWEGIGEDITGETNVLPVILIDGEWHVQQYIKYSVQPVQGDVKVGGCTPVLE